MTIAITRGSLGASGLRAAAARSKHAASSRRMLALLLDGATRAAAAQAAGMDRQTLRDWVHRYNERGLDGLKNLPNLGAPPCKLTPEQEAMVTEWVRQGPRLEQHNVVRWRLVDLRDAIERQFGAYLHERTIGKPMARLNFARVSVRPRYPAQDADAQAAHKKTLPHWSQPLSRSLPAASRSNSGGKMKPASASKAA